MILQEPSEAKAKFGKRKRSYHRAKYDRQLYGKKWIDKKIGNIIRSQRKIDKRFYLFRGVLSETAINICMLAKAPRVGLAVIQPGRKWTPEGCFGLQNLLRNEWVYEEKTAKKEDKGDTEGGRGDKQRMKFEWFYSKVAEKLNIPTPSVSIDKVIMHEPSLKVL